MNNINNKLIRRHIIEKIINKYMDDTPVRINNIKQFQKAFIHKSFCIVDSDNSDSDNYSSMTVEPHLLNNNERLEFLGDKVIDLITTEYLFDTFPNKDEGFLTKLKAKLVKKESLSMLGEKLGFRELILISSHIERISGRNNPRFLEDIFESFIGILYKDQKSNLNICRKFLLGVYNDFINIDNLIKNNDNYKDSLLRYFHSKGWGHPVYINIFHRSNVHTREFITVVLLSKDVLHENFIQSQNKILQIIKDETDEDTYTEFINSLKNNIVIGIGKSNTKKSSEQACSKECLINLKISVNY